MPKQQTTSNLIREDTLNELEQGQRLYNTPSGPAIDMAHKVLGAGRAGLAQMPDRWRKVSHGQSMEVQASAQKRRVIANSLASTVTLELDDLDKLAGSNKGAKKILDFILITMDKQAYIGGTMIRDYINFSLQDLIKAGIYSTPQSSRRGFKDAMSTITSMKFRGELRKGTKNTVSQTTIEVLFTGAHLKSGICTVYINSRVNWNFVMSFYTIMPQWCFQLKNNAYDLVRYIFYLARQNTQEIEAKGYFTISMRAIHAVLNLPDVAETTHPKQDIREPIEKAIEEIELLNNDSDFTITPRNCDPDIPIGAYLSKGYLEIGLKGKYHYFANLALSTAKQIEAHHKHQEQIKEKAAVKAISEKLKATQQNNTK